MSTKTEIQADISSKLASGSTILASEHREVENELLDSFYPDEITENETTNTITINNANFEYIVKIVKIGRLVSMEGTFECVNSVTDFGYIFQIDLSNAEFKPSETGLSNQISVLAKLAAGASSIENIYTDCFILSNGDLQVRGSILAGETGSFIITYNTFN